MDLNGDGNLDILSGCYSRHDQDMAGLFYVLWGTKDHKFKKPEALKGSDGELLIIPADRKNLTDKICTRPTAADIDGDGDLDLVVGNFGGTFFVFTCNDKKEYDPKPKKIMVGEKPLNVPHHSDPFLVDWDKDGDLDMLSGSSSGGVFLSINKGSKSKADFSKMKPLMKPLDRKELYSSNRFGTDHITGPQGSTRVYAADLNGDGKLDLVVGDNQSISLVADGVDEKDVPALLKKWDDGQKKLMEELTEARKAQTEVLKENKDDKEAVKEAKDRYNKVMQQYSKSFQAREKIVKTKSRGTVWVYYQK